MTTKCSLDHRNCANHRTGIKASIVAAAIIVFSSFTAIARADAPHIFLDSRSTAVNPNDKREELMLREIPRQMLLVALQEDLERPCVVRDATVEPAAKPQKDDIVIGIERKLETTDRSMKLTLRLLDGQNRLMDETVVDAKWNTSGVEYEDLVRHVDFLIRGKWLSLVAKQLSATTRPGKQASDWKLPANVEEWLNDVDFHHAFLAARTLHSAIIASGSSAQAYSALARSYANLGDSTRHLWDGQSSAFFARAMVYAQRLSDLDHGSALEWWTRGYVQTLLGENRDALFDFLGADKIKGEKPPAPEWVEMSRELNQFDTIALYGRIGQTKSALASYFSFLTIEFSMMPSLQINYARAAIHQDPSALRLEQAIGDNGGVILGHQTTQEAARMLNRMTALLAADADDALVRAAAASATRQQFNLSAIIQLRDALEARPAEAGQAMPWSTYAAFIREDEFINALNRLYFVGYELSTDPAADLREWWPLVSDHRFAPLLAAVGTYGQPGDPALLKKAAELSFKDDVCHSKAVTGLIPAMGLSSAGLNAELFTSREYYQMDTTGWDRAWLIWAYREAAEKSYIDSQMAVLGGVSPGNPLCLAQDFIDDWKRRSKVADVWLKRGRNPIISFGIAEAYLQNSEFDKAVAALKDVVKFAPDRITYQALADAYLAENDEKSWLKTWDDYLQNEEDLGLDHAWAGKLVAERLNWHQRSDDALPYAKIAADSYSAWGLEIYAWTLANVHQYDQAANVEQQCFERYGDPSSAYSFFVTIGRGDRAGAAKAYPQWYANTQTGRPSPDSMLAYALFLLAEGQGAEADAVLHKAFDQSPERIIGIILAMRELEQGKPDDAQAVLSKAQIVAAKGDQDARFDLCIAELQRCIKDPAALPARDGRLVKSFADWDGAGQTVSAASVMGRLCELRQRPDDARWWYRQAFVFPQGDYTFRPLAALALRRLGEEPYK